jgi:hypothetical protein
MLGRPDVGATKPTRRRLAYRLAFVGVVVALVAGISAVLLTAVLPSCCASPADLIVLNYDHQDASVDWNGPGLFGTPLLATSGSATASGCKTLSVTLPRGAVEVSIHLGGATARLFHVQVRESLEDRTQHGATIVIGADGHIADPIDGSPSNGYPQDPLC